MKRVFVLLKRSAYDLYVSRHQDPAFTSLLEKPNRVVGNLLERHKSHIGAVEKCKEVLSRKSIAWESLMRDELNKPIQNVDLVVTLGGDGTLLQASHFLDGSIPVLGVNSDPTKLEELEEQTGEFDATRSRGFLCGATSDNFEEVLDHILHGRWRPKMLRRISTSIDGEEFGTPALNDVLLAHPNPAAVTRCSFSIVDKDGVSPLVHTRSSGLRVCTAAGSTAATHSAGGFPMPLQSTDLQYMLREPILPHPRQTHLMHGFVHQGQFGSVVKLSADGPPLQVFLQESK